MLDDRKVLSLPSGQRQPWLALHHALWQGLRADQTGVSDVLTPVHAWWASLGYPNPVGTPQAGVCGTCGHTGSVYPVETVVSRSFTGWDRVPNGLWCPACAYAHANPAARTDPVVVHVDGTTQAGWATVRQVLRAGHLGPGVAVVAPVTGRTHMLAAAYWGSVTTDAGRFGWTVEDTTRFVRACTLVDAGVSATQLGEPAPPVSLFNRSGPIRGDEVLNWWDDLVPWRERGVSWWRMIVNATKG